MASFLRRAADRGGREGSSLPAFLLLAGLALTLAACGTPQGGAQQQAPQNQPVEAPPEPETPGGMTEDGKIGIGFLAPLSGPQAGVGQAILQAAQMAFLDNADEDASLLVADTGGNAAMAARATQELIDRGAAIIIGPLFSGSVRSAAPVAQRAGVPLLAFTNDQSAATPGVYTLGLSPSAQVERVVDYAARNGLLRFAAFAPADRYGRLAAEALTESATPPLEVLETTFYAADASDIDPVAKAFAGRVLEIDPLSAQNASSDRQPKKIPLFDALLMPDGGQRLLGVAPYLPYYDVAQPEVRYLGTQLWDAPEVAREPALHGAWFAAPDPQPWNDFARRYGQLYGEVPPRVASLGYDATAIAAVFARGQAASFDAASVYGPENLTQQGGFFGIDGIFRLLPDGTIERGLAVLELQAGGAVVIDPAPQAFEAGF